MLITKKVKIKTRGRLIKYYKDLGYDVEYNKEIIVNINDLSKGSKIIVETKCDICNREKDMNYCDYIKSISNDGYLTCRKCSIEKRKKTNNNKYGVDFPIQLETIIKKREQTYLERYGETTNLKTEETKNKIKQTLLLKYGVENISQNEEIKEKKKRTTFLNYGVENPLQSKEIQEKIKKSGFRIFDKENYKIYKNLVINITNKNKKKLYDMWDGYDYYDGEYIKDNFSLHSNDNNRPSIDHKISTMNGFRNKISPEKIGHINNLCITKRIINSIKNIKNEDEF